MQFVQATLRYGEKYYRQVVPGNELSAYTLGGIKTRSKTNGGIFAPKADGILQNTELSKTHGIIFCTQDIKLVHQKARIHAEYNH